jgi:predicted DNA-binding transcriptional regulator AlpA
MKRVKRYHMDKQGLLPDVFYQRRLLSSEEVENHMGISRTTLWRLMKRKKNPLPSFKIGRNTKFKLDKVLWWIDNNEE